MNVFQNEIFMDVRPHILKRFMVFHAENPHVFELVKRFANELRQVGRERYAIATIIERIRWHVDVETRSQDPFKINCNHASCYARLLVATDPSYAGFFQLRTHQEYKDAKEKEPELPLHLGQQISPANHDSHEPGCAESASQ